MLSSNKIKEEILFEKEYNIKIEKVRKKLLNSPFENDYFEEVRVTLNNKNIEIDKDFFYKQLIRRIIKKLSVLNYLRNEESIEAIKDEVIADLLTILYKLEMGDKE